MSIPKDCRYTKDHEWAKPEGSGKYIVGITDYAQTELGDVVFVELPPVGKSVKQGESFEDLALQYSDGPTAPRGGRLGLVRQGELLPAIERGVANLVPGGISEVVESPEGLHIVRLDDKKPKQFRPYEEVRQEIQALVFQQKSEDMFQSWLADLKNRAYIEIKFDNAPLKQTTSVPAPPPSPTSRP